MTFDERLFISKQISLSYVFLLLSYSKQKFEGELNCIQKNCLLMPTPSDIVNFSSNFQKNAILALFKQ